MTAALESYLYSIQQIAEIIEAISPESATSFREPLLSLRSRLAADPTPAALEQSRDALHELLQSFCQRARLQNETLARDLNQTLSMVTRTGDSARGAMYSTSNSFSISWIGSNPPSDPAICRASLLGPPNCETSSNPSNSIAATTSPGCARK